MTARPSVTVVVVARNEAGNIGACLRSLAAQDYVGLKVILVDDGSTDDTVCIARQVMPCLKVLSNPCRSISANRNLGWRSAATDFVAFLDADCEARSDWISTLVGLATETGAAAVGGGNVPPVEESRHYAALAVMLSTYAGSRGSVQGQVPATARQVSHLPGLNVLYRVSALELVDGFDERFARMGEDEDLSRRLCDIGLQLFACPDATVVHRQRPGTLSWARNMLHYGRGRTWLLRRHPNGWSPTLLLPPLAALFWPVYLPSIAVYALIATIRAGQIRRWPRVTLLFAATHLPYGIGQILGLFSTGDNPRVKRRRRVGFIALKNAGNKGDEAISVCVLSRVDAAIRRTGAPADAYLAGLGPSGFDIRPVPRGEAARNRLVLQLLAPTPDSRKVQPAHLVADGFRCLIVFARFRAMVIAGGQWLHDLSLAKHVAITGMFAFARACGTATGVFCVGTGPLRRGFSRWLTRRGFGRSSCLVTRDDGSTQTLHRAGLGHAVTAADPALDLQADPVDAVFGRILLTPCAWGSFTNIYDQNRDQIDRNLASWRAVLAALLDRGYSVAILPTMNPEDHAFAMQVAEGRPETEILPTAELTPTRVQGEIAASAALVSMRLHPIIFATNSSVPFVALDYSDKVHSFCEQAGLADRIVELSDGDWAAAALKTLDRTLASPIAPAAEAQRTDQLAALDAGYDRLFDWLGIDRAARPR